ncbi:unnamed protein product [Brachionus calyciflorus]|uniref:Proteasome maturation protein n=1 Tax=Brachionus calyciflorus TaxID=104777 RepID=A0A813LYJ7_9BILA|nr:unnamed protein product [Brachionus calyciflorus]
MNIKDLRENSFGVQDTLNYGILNIKSNLTPAHHLENQEKNFHKLEEKNLLSSLRISQGLYAPLKLQMERKFAQKTNRLPALQSSNLMLSVLKGTDETIEVEDIFNNQREFCENNYDSHATTDLKY